MTALADPTRSRLLLALERNELSVNELRSILQLPQSTISRHLKMLSAEGWVEARAEGTSRHYRLATDSLDPASRRLWHIVRDEVMHSSAAEHDARRTQAVLAERSTRSQQFFSTSAGQWDRMRLELFGRRADVALLGLLDESWVVADLGCGTGAITQSLAPFVERVIAVDESGAMLRPPQRSDFTEWRTSTSEMDGWKHCRSRMAKSDVALLFLVLHYVSRSGARDRGGRSRAQAGRTTSRARHDAARPAGPAADDGAPLAGFRLDDTRRLDAVRQDWNPSATTSFPPIPTPKVRCCSPRRANEVQLQQRAARARKRMRFRS